jgi:hypothetical protein
VMCTPLLGVMSAEVAPPFAPPPMASLQTCMRTWGVRRG